MKDYDNKYSITITQYKIVFTISELNKDKLYPSLKGLRNILIGADDTETRKYKYLDTYACLLSIQKRTLAAQVTNLVRAGVLSYKYDSNTDDMYLMVTTKGKEIIYDYLKHHKVRLVSKDKVVKNEIVKIA